MQENLRGEERGDQGTVIIVNCFPIPLLYSESILRRPINNVHPNILE